MLLLKNDNKNIKKALKGLSSALFFFLWIILSNSFYFQYFLFKTFQKEITKNYCVNRFQSENLCRASCYFANIQKEEQKKNLPNQLLNQWFNFECLPTKDSNILGVNPFVIVVKYTIYNDYNMLKGHHALMEKPPCFLV